jgi:hypothetical protein
LEASIEMQATQMRSSRLQAFQAGASPFGARRSAAALPLHAGLRRCNALDGVAAAPLTVGDLDEGDEGPAAARLIARRRAGE